MMNMIIIIKEGNNREHVNADFGIESEIIAAKLVEM